MSGALRIRAGYACLVADAGLKGLAALNQLKVLMLDDTIITDEGLKTLAQMKSLKKVSLSKSKATEAGVAALKKALPDCEVVNKK